MAIENVIINYLITAVVIIEVIVNVIVAVNLTGWCHLIIFFFEQSFVFCIAEEANIFLRLLVLI